MNVIALLFSSKFYLNIKYLINTDSYSEKEKINPTISHNRKATWKMKLVPDYMRPYLKYAEAILLHKMFSYSFNKRVWHY